MFRPQHRQKSSSITVLSKDLNPVLRIVLIILVLGTVLAVLVLFRSRQPSAEVPDADMEAQRAAVADEEAETGHARAASQAVNSAAQALDDYAGPSTMMNLSPIHHKPDNNLLPPALPMPVVTPAPRPRTTRQLYRGRPFGFTMDPAGIVPA
ncbi:hypothetical protein N0V83_003800 [Neocucurbitaria cava]|uniref:Uncharacterized protein n=1 Tax=Neocucurbitaria cava TaxID=798079 RepID=A0A9W8YAR0_9PLEO|nr:hypothetical protein N0V83_003800 [Neocucurbitaria cava]